MDTLLGLPRLLWSKDGPLVIRPSYLGTMLPWMARAAATISPSRHDAIVAAMASVTAPAIDCFDALTAASGASQLVTRDGLLVACRHAPTLEARAARMPWWERSGILATRVDASQMKALVPALRSDLAGGLFFPNSGRVSDPGRLGLAYAERLRAGGATVAKTRVLGIRTVDGKIAHVRTSHGELVADCVVVCAGHASKALIEGLGQVVPLAAERGYHLMLDAHLAMERPVIFGEPYFGATPMAGGLRLAGTAEFASPDAVPNWKRAWLLLQQAKEYLDHADKLAAANATPWMGVRPSFPDGMPAIGRLSDHPNVFYAFGHGHNGLTLSAVTAQCMASLVAGKRPTIDINPFSLERFRDNRRGPGHRISQQKPKPKEKVI